MIAIISAMDLEMTELVNNLEEKKESFFQGQKFYEGKIGHNDVVISSSGIGKVNAAINTAILISKYKPSLIINSGIAGGVKLELNDVVLASKLCYSDVDATFFGYEYGMIPGMPLYFYPDSVSYMKAQTILKDANINFKLSPVLTADTFRDTAKDIKNKMNEAYAVEMEGAAIAQTCHRLNTPFLSIRFISDILDTDKHTENYQAFEKEASLLSSKITLKIINNL